MMHTAWLAVLCLLLPAAAQAFSDPDLFGQPAARGGGGGRYFTGSPADGHACSVCHRGGIEPIVTISGLPDEFEAGVPYDVTVRWDQPAISHGLQLELLTAAGESPLVELPPSEALSAGARCESAADGDPAVYLLTLDRRQIVGVRDCGASEVSFRFVGPSSPRIAVSASIVRSDSSGTSEGDGVFDLREVIYARGQSPRESGCSLVSPSRARKPDLTVLAVFVLFAVGRGGRPRRTRFIERLSRKSTPVLGCALWLASCYQPDFSSDYVRLDEPLFDAGLALPLDAAPGAQDLDATASLALDAQNGLLDAQNELPDARVARPTQLSFRVLTAPVGGRYAPRNIGAIWIEDANGVFVRTLERWALTRAMYLRRFQAASGGDLTDAVTSATLSTHVVHEVRWNLQSASGLEVSDGSYRLLVELTDRDSTGLTLEVPFVKGSDTITVRPEDTAQFRNMELTLR